MGKIIDKVLYFFGYAPIKISHEVVEHYVVKELNYEVTLIRKIVEKQKQNSLAIDYDRVMEDKAIRELAIEVTKYFEKIETSFLGEKTTSFEICIVKRKYQKHGS